MANCNHLGDNINICKTNSGESNFNGTTVKYNPVTVSDIAIINGQRTLFKLKHHCITVMEDYQLKSLEELRMEDYACNRKGPYVTFGNNFASTSSENSFTRNLVPKMFESLGVSFIDVVDSSTLQPNGTAIKFIPVVDSESNLYSLSNVDIKKSERSIIRYQGITFMKEYESKEFEELRLEDYKNMLNKKVVKQIEDKKYEFSDKLFKNNHNINSVFNSSHSPSQFTSAKNCNSIFTPSITSILGTKLKFHPVEGHDVGIINGKFKTIKTRHQCITVMQEYKLKSLEELRLDDYLLNRKNRKYKNSIGLNSSNALIKKEKVYKIEKNAEEKNNFTASLTNQYKNEEVPQAVKLLQETITTQERIIIKIKEMSLGLRSLINVVRPELRQKEFVNECMEQDELLVEDNNNDLSYKVVVLGINENDNDKMMDRDGKNVIINFFMEKLGYEIAKNDILRVDKICCHGYKGKRPIVVEFKSEKIESDVLNLVSKLAGSKISVYKYCCS